MASRRLLVAVLSLLCMTTMAPARGQDTAAVRFRPLDVYVDSGTRPLAAYQIEVAVVSGRGEIVGVEGGEHQAFRAAPYYDPAALQGGRIIIAAFSTSADLPTGRTRVATLHMQESRTELPDYQAKLMVAASIDGHRIEAVASLKRAQGAVR
jgi:hypothetical protein